MDFSKIDWRHALVFGAAAALGAAFPGIPWYSLLSVVGLH